EDRLPAADVELPRDHGRRPRPDLPDARRGAPLAQPGHALEGRRGEPARRRTPLRRVQLPARHHTAAQADADRHFRAARLAAAGQARAAHPVSHDPHPPAADASSAVLRRSRWAWIVSIIAALCAGLVLVFLLGVATNNPALYERHYVWLFWVNVALAETLVAVIVAAA